MKINRTNKKINKKSVIAVISIVALLVLVASIVYAVMQPEEDRPENTVDYTDPTDDQLRAGEIAKKEFEKRQTEASKEREAANIEKDGDKTSQPDGYEEIVGMHISSISKDGDTLSIRTVIASIDSSGSCKLTLAKDGESDVVQSVGTQSLGSYTVCKGFDIDTSRISKGEWSADIEYVGSEDQKASTSRRVTI